MYIRSLITGEANGCRNLLAPSPISRGTDPVVMSGAAVRGLVLARRDSRPEWLSALVDVGYQVTPIRSFLRARLTGGASDELIYADYMSVSRSDSAPVCLCPPRYPVCTVSAGGKTIDLLSSSARAI